MDFHLPTVDANLKFPQTVVNLVMTDDFAIEDSTTQKNCRRFATNGINLDEDMVRDSIC